MLTVLWDSGCPAGRDALSHVASEPLVQRWTSGGRHSTRTITVFSRGLSGGKYGMLTKAAGSRLPGGVPDVVEGWW